jgi:AcrR family transcriptional regulator
MQDTKDKILEAAEQLFAEQGFAATSMRNITARAGVNVAAVNYHFGSKISLLKAVFELRFKPINEQRLKALDALEAEAGEGPLELEKLLIAFLGPAVRLWKEWGEVGERFVQFVGRAHSEANPDVQKMFQELFSTIVNRFLPAFQRALPDIPPDEIPLKAYFMIGAMAHTMAWHKKLAFVHNDPMTTLDADVLLDRLVSFSAAGMRAPVKGAVK